MSFNAVLDDLNAFHPPLQEFPAPLTEQQKSDFKMTIVSCLAQDFTFKQLKEFLPAANLNYNSFNMAKEHAADSTSYPLFETRTVAIFKILFLFPIFWYPNIILLQTKFRMFSHLDK